MKKILKFIVYTIGVIVLLAILLVLALPLWLGPVVKPTVRVAAPKITGTSFELGHLYLNPYTGRLEVGGLVLGNPKGYSEPVAVALSNLVFDAAMSTLGDKYIHVEEITVDGLFVSYLDGGEHDVDNFTQIQYNVAGGKEKYEAAKKLAEEEKAKEGEKPADDAGEAEEDVSKRKFVVDKLTIKNVRVKYGVLPAFSVPVDIVLTDIGKESEGATLSEVCEQAWQAILKSAGAVGDGVKEVGSFLGEQAGKLGDAVKSVDLQGVGEGASKTTEAVGEGAKKATDAVKNMLNL